jgi:hypothetical protein
MILKWVLGNPAVNIVMSIGIHFLRTRANQLDSCWRTLRILIEMVRESGKEFLSLVPSLVSWNEGETVSNVSATVWPIVPAPDNWWWRVCSSRWNDWQGTPKYSEKTCSSAALSTINLTWSDLDSNPGRRGGKPATNRLNYGTAKSLSGVLYSTMESKPSTSTVDTIYFHT